MSHITVTVAGDLPKSIIEAIADNIRPKPSPVENAECKINWIG